MYKCVLRLDCFDEKHVGQRQRNMLCCVEAEQQQVSASRLTKHNFFGNIPLFSCN